MGEDESDIFDIERESWINEPKLLESKDEDEAYCEIDKFSEAKLWVAVDDK